MPFITPVKNEQSREGGLPRAFGPPVSLGESFSQNFKTAWKTSLFISESWNTRSLIADMQTHYNQVVGDDELPDPFNDPMNQGGAPSIGTVGLNEEKLNEFFDVYSKVQQAEPDHELSQITGMDDFQNQITSRLQASEQELSEVNARETSAWNTIAGLGGQFSAAMLDTPNLLSLMAGAPAGASLTRIGLTEMGINAVLETSMQPKIQEYRGEHGLYHGTDVAIQNILFATGAGAVAGPAFAGAFRGGRMLLGLPPVPRRGRLTPDEIMSIRENLATGLRSPEMQARLTMQEDLHRSLARLPFEDEPLFKPSPRGARQHLQNMMKVEQDIRNSRDPQINTDIQPPARSTDNMADVDIPGTRSEAEFSMRDVELDTETFPLRGEDAPGVSRETTTGRSDPFVLFEREDGTTNPVDELGKRSASLARQTDEDVTGSAFIFREADGWTPDEVNRIAMLKDFRDGRISASRVADEIGVSQSFLERMPDGSVIHRDAPGLSALDRGVLAHVLREDVPANHAARIGDRILDGRDLTPDEQLEILRVLEREQPANLEEADELVDESIEALTMEETRTLFGDEQRPRVVFEQRNQILDRAMTRIENEQPELLDRLVDEQQRVQNAGDSARNVDIIENRSQAAEVLRNLARKKGELSDALTESARSLRTSGNLGDSVDEFVGQTRAAINRGVVDQQISQRGRPTQAADRIHQRSNQAEEIRKSVEHTRERVENLEQTVEDLDEDFRATVGRMQDDMDDDLRDGLRAVLGREDADIEDMPVSVDPDRDQITVSQMFDELDEDSAFIRAARDCL